ncbi:hypothetical protein FA95DRAFT_1498541, partial [Auriscalpium vulgare]
FNQTGTKTDLKEAIALHRKALMLRPSGHADRPMSLSNLANALSISFNQNSTMPDLEEAITLHREALTLRPSEHPDYSIHMNNLATVLMTHFNQMGTISDLEEAIRLHRMVLILRPSGHPSRSISIINLGGALMAHFNQMGTISDLEEAISLYRETLALMSSHNANYSMALNNLASALWIHFNQRGTMSHLKEAITLHREALSLRPFGHPYRPMSLTNLANALWGHFNQIGIMSDLEEALLLHREALSLTPAGHSHRSQTLTYLANTLWTYFNQMPDRTSDLEEAIELYREALTLTLSEHPDRPKNLSNLAGALQTHFLYRGTMSHLEESIKLYREVLTYVPSGHPDRSMNLNNLACALVAYHKWINTIHNLEEAIALHREALTLRPSGHLERAMSLTNLARALTAHVDQKGTEKYLIEAISLYMEANKLFSMGSPDKIECLYSLATSLIIQDSRFGHGTISDEAWKVFEDASDYSFADTLKRLNITLEWASIARHHRDPTTMTAYQKALVLFEQCLIIRPTPELQHRFLQTIDEKALMLPSDAVSWAIEVDHLKGAAQLWEQGRRILWSKMKDYRFPITKLKLLDSALAEQFETVTQQLDQLTTRSFEFQSVGTYVMENQWPIKRQLTSRWNEIVKEIQDIPGFETFLSAQPFSSISKASADGPVILVNISAQRSDALILYQVDSLPILVSLLDIPNKTVHDIVNELAYILRPESVHQDSAKEHQPYDNTILDQNIEKVLTNLWKYIVHPIMKKIDELGLSKGSRIWWCPSGKLCTLPLHAAQPFGKHTDPEQQLSQKYIHSYTPTLQSLIKARENIFSRELETPPQILALATSSLKKVYNEIDEIEAVSGNTKKLIGEMVTYHTMIENLPKFDWIHFASHGHIDSKKPFNSSFELHNKTKFTILDLLATNLPNAELAVLSACHTAAVDKDNTPDEGISLAAGMLFCGFRGIVGTLWAMDDEDGPLLAKEFYCRILHPKNKPVDFKDAAKVLKAVTKEMRRQDVPLHRWVAFVHIGA